MKILTSLIITLFLTSCSGGTDSGVNIDTQPTLATADLVADKNFDFKTNRNITLTITNSDNSKGAYSIYKESVDTGSTEMVIADPLSRITSVRSTLQTTVDLMVNDNWNEIVVLWVPEIANGKELSMRINLNRDVTYYTIDF